MAEKILLSTFILKISNKKNQELQLLEQFNGSADYFKIIQNFLSKLLKDELTLEASSKTHKIHLTMEISPIVKEKEREIYGYFSSGISGEKFKIKDRETRTDLQDVDPNKHGSYRNLFFYLRFPKNMKEGALIMQRKSKFGIKTMLNTTLNQHLKNELFIEQKIQITNLFDKRVYDKMMSDGRLKKLDLIKRRLPSNLEDYFGNDKLFEDKGRTTISFYNEAGFGKNWKAIVNKIFSKETSNNDRIEINGIEDDFDEVEFELFLNGRKKKFYINSREKIQPDIDVTDKIKIENGEPTEKSMLEECRELYTELYRPQIK